MSIALISGNLKLRQTSSPAQFFTGTVLLFRIFCINFIALFCISFVISGICRRWVFILWCSIVWRRTVWWLSNFRKK